MLAAGVALHLARPSTWSRRPAFPSGTSLSFGLTAGTSLR